MADIDNQEQEQKGAGVLGGVGSLGVGYLAGSTAGKLYKAPDGIDQATLDKKKGELTTKRADIVKNGDQQLKDLSAIVDGAEVKKTGLETAHTEAQRLEWWNHINTKAKPQEVAKLREAHLDAHVAAIDAAPATTEAEKTAQKWARETIGKQKTAITTLKGTEGFKKLAETDAAGANAMIKAEVDKIWEEAIKTGPADGIARVHAADQLLQTGGTHAGDLVKKFASADSKIAESVNGTEGVKKAAEGVKTATTELTTATNNFKPKFEAATGAGEFKTLEKEVGKLTKNVEANAEQNFFKRGAKLAFKGTGKQQAAVIATALLATGLTYLGVKAYRNRDKGETTSYADQITQERAAAAAAPDQSASAGRG